MPQSYHRNTGEESEDSCRETLVARFFEYQREAGCTYDACRAIHHRTAQLACGATDELLLFSARCED